jgi:hypothetical protein
MPPAPETCWPSIRRQSPGSRKTLANRLSQPSRIVPHRRAQRHASLSVLQGRPPPACAQALSQAGAWTMNRQGDWQRSPLGLPAHATACYRQLLASSGCPSADAPFGGLNHASKSPCRTSSRHRPANGAPLAAHHHPQRKPGKSIAANAAPPHIQSNRVSAAASRLRNSYSFACARLSQPCLPRSRPGVSATLTTTAFDRSSLRWLGIDDLIAEPEGPSFISRTVAHRRYSRRRS